MGSTGDRSYIVSHVKQSFLILLHHFVADGSDVGNKN
jgi:hypothetical protein